MTIQKNKLTKDKILNQNQYDYKIGDCAARRDYHSYSTIKRNLHIASPSALQSKPTEKQFTPVHGIVVN